MIDLLEKKQRHHSEDQTWTVSLTNFLNSGAIVAGASGLSLWTKSFNLNSLQVGMLGAFSANAFGAAIGALLGGWLSDRFGRKFIYNINMLIYFIGTLIVILANQFMTLLLGFIVTGLAVGIGIPTAWTYAAESSSGSGRARQVGISQFSWALGPVLIFFLGTLTSRLNVLGARILFVILAILSLMTWWLQRQLPESDQWLAQKKYEQKTGKKNHPYRELFGQWTNIKTILFLLGVYLFWNLVSGAMGFFMPYVYVQAGGLTNTQANMLQVGLWLCTALGTYYGFSHFGDLINQRLLFAIGGIGEIIAWGVLTYGGMNWACLIAFIILWGLSAGLGAQAWYSLWSSELFPTKYRGSSQGVTFFVVYGSSGIWSLVFPTLLARFGLTLVGTLMILLLVISLLIGTIWTPQTQGKTLTEIINQRYYK